LLQISLSATSFHSLLYFSIAFPKISVIIESEHKVTKPLQDCKNPFSLCLKYDYPFVDSVIESMASFPAIKNFEIK